MSAATIITELLERSGLPKAELARRAGVSRSLLHSYLRGGTSPSLTQLQRIADAAGCTLDMRVRPAKADEFFAVLEFGAIFPAREPDPLPDMSHVWQRDEAA